MSDQNKNQEAFVETLKETQRGPAMKKLIDYLANNTDFFSKDNGELLDKTTRLWVAANMEYGNFCKDTKTENDRQLMNSISVAALLCLIGQTTEAQDSVIGDTDADTALYIIQNLGVRLTNEEYAAIFYYRGIYTGCSERYARNCERAYHNYCLPLILHLAWENVEYTDRYMN